MTNIEIIDIVMMIIMAILIALMILSKKYITPLLSKIANDLAVNIGEVEMEKIDYWVSVLVRAAEMIFAGENKGAEKKNYVETQLKSMGYEMNETNNAIIESAVYEIKKEVKR